MGKVIQLANQRSFVVIDIMKAGELYIIEIIPLKDHRYTEVTTYSEKLREILYDYTMYDRVIIVCSLAVKQFLLGLDLGPNIIYCIVGGIK
jgi:hypothetical protein